MFTRSLILIFAAFLVSCNITEDYYAWKLDPELRETALDAYTEILGECTYQGTEMRQNILTPEREELFALEVKSRGTLAAVDLGLAKQEYEAKYPNGAKLSCVIGNRPVKPSDFDRNKKRAQYYISELSAAIGSQSQAAELPNWLNADNALEYRELITGIYWQVNGFGCGSYVFDGLVFEEEAKKLEQFENSISGTDYAYHSAIAKDDAEYENDTVMYECIDPYTEKEREEAIAEGKANIMKNLDRLKEIVETKVQE